MLLGLFLFVLSRTHLHLASLNIRFGGWRGKMRSGESKLYSFLKLANSKKMLSKYTEIFYWKIFKLLASISPLFYSAFVFIFLPQAYHFVCALSACLEILLQL